MQIPRRKKKLKQLWKINKILVDKSLYNGYIVYIMFLTTLVMAVLVLGKTLLLGVLLTHDEEKRIKSLYNIRS